MQSFWKKALASLLLLLLLFALPCCGNSGTTDENGIVKLSFRAAASYDELKKLNGKQVKINGYMATSSPVDGSFLFLMNLPYQSCPFCKPNTSELSNTMEVYPKKGESFGHTDQAITVTGTLEVADEQNSFTDPYGYVFNFKIVDAEYRIIPAEELNEKMALWQKIAESGLISDLYAMYDYVNFTCAWDTYFVSSYENENGETIPGYYLYAADAINYLKTDGAQWNYGYKEGYFDELIGKIKKLSTTELSDLVKNVEDAKQLAADAIAELDAGHYSYTRQYVEKFGTEDDVYTLDKGAELQARMDKLYTDFSNWLGAWEL